MAVSLDGGSLRSVQFDHVVRNYGQAARLNAQATPAVFLTNLATNTKKTQPCFVKILSSQRSRTEGGCTMTDSAFGSVRRVASPHRGDVDNQSCQ